MLTDIKYVNYFHNRRQDRGGVAGGGTAAVAGLSNKWT